MKPCILKLYERLNRFIIDSCNNFMYRMDEKLSNDYYEMIQERENASTNS